MPPPGPARDERRLLGLLNQERSAGGLDELRWHAGLARLARAHAADMKRSGRTGHRSSVDGADFTERLARSGIRAAGLAENVAFARDIRSVHDGLMLSPGHRANILNGALTAVGIGIVADREGRGVYVVEDFVSLMDSLDDAQAAERVRRAVKAAAPGLGEDAELSRRLAVRVKALAVADSVDVADLPLEGPLWVVAFTATDPGTLPDAVRRKVGSARAFGLAVAFHKTPTYPLGVYWVLLGLHGSF